MKEAVDWSSLTSHPQVSALIDLAVQEDLGSGDVTTNAVFDCAQAGRGDVIARSATVVCGIPLLPEIFRRIGSGVEVEPLAPEGERVAAGTPLATLRGDVRLLLAGERCALNFAMRLCGIATATRNAVERLPGGCRTRIYDTRKTLPGWRLLDKAAVRTGGGENHRTGLFDALLIKDNHIAAAGSVGEALRRGRTRAPAGHIVEIEVDTLEQLGEILSGDADLLPDIILLDNFDDSALAKAVQQAAGRVELEASGGVTLERLPAIAATGVDRVSLGALTHTVVPADLALDFVG